MSGVNVETETMTAAPARGIRIRCAACRPPVPFASA